MSNENGMICDVHNGLPLPPSMHKSCLVRGSYQYYFYGCNGVLDQGWGCGYRTLQTICSWLNINTAAQRKCTPSLREIQQVLVDLGDKVPSFVGSREWIGSYEVCIVVDQLYNIPCKILHVDKGKNLRNFTEDIFQHFTKFSSPVMMGGDKDCSSKGILGIAASSSGDTYLLVLDPHFDGKHPTPSKLQEDGWVKWQHLDEFIESSFYNLCLPQIGPTEETS